MDELRRLAHLLRQWNAIGDEIARLIDRPAQSGHIAEFVAAKIFGINLALSASNKGSDGVFMEGPLAGHTVNIKWSAKYDGLLNLVTTALPDYYLVLRGPKSPAGSSRGKVRPWDIKSVFLFEAGPLHERLAARSAKIGVATSVAKDLWTHSEVFPDPRNPLFSLTASQCEFLNLFSLTAGCT
jgi:hypothetical protein